MRARLTPEERLRALFLTVATANVGVAVGLGFTSLRGPGTGWVLVFAAAFVAAAGLVTAVLHRRRRNRCWPRYRHPS